MLNIIIALIPSLLKGLAAIIQDYEQSKSDANQLAAQVQAAFNQAGQQAAQLVSDFGQPHIAAFLKQLAADAPAK